MHTLNPTYKKSSSECEVVPLADLQTPPGYTPPLRTHSEHQFEVSLGHYKWLSKKPVTFEA